MTDHPQTATERFIRHGVAGGYSLPSFELQQSLIALVSASKPETSKDAIRIQDFTNKAITAIALLDPEFWRAAGRSLGTNLPEMRCDSPRCDMVQCEYGGYIDPKAQMLGLVEWLWGHPGDVEEYLAELLTKNKRA